MPGADPSTGACAAHVRRDADQLVRHLADAFLEAWLLIATHRRQACRAILRRAHTATAVQYFQTGQKYSLEFFSAYSSSKHSWAAPAAVLRPSNLPRYRHAVIHMQRPRSNRGSAIGFQSGSYRHGPFCRLAEGSNGRQEYPAFRDNSQLLTCCCRFQGASNPCSNAKPPDAVPAFSNPRAVSDCDGFTHAFRLDQAVNAFPGTIE